MNTINDLIRLRVSEKPDDVGFFVRGTESQWTPITWRTFQIQVHQLAAALMSKGLQKGDRVAIIAHTCFQWELADKASLLCGAVVVGIDPHAPVEHISAILRDSEAQYVFVNGEMVYEKLPVDLRSQLKFVGVFEPRHTESQMATLSFWDDLFQDASGASFSPPTVSGEDLAILVYTSGTTGDPKGIPYTHQQVLVACHAIQAVLAGFESGGRLICWLPLANLFQRMVNLVSATTGQRTYFWEDPRTIAQAIQSVQPTYFIGVPRFYEKVRQAIQVSIDSQPEFRKRLIRLALAIGERKSDAIQRKKSVPTWIRIASRLAEKLVLSRIRGRAFGSGIRFCFTGSAPINPDVLAYFHSIGLLVLEAYALSENIVPIAINRSDDFRFGSVGKPVVPNEVRIRSDGVILVRGPGVCAGYWRSEGNEPARDQEGFMETGDHGRFDQDGYLFLTGRDSDIIKTSTGRRISLAWIESVYRRSNLFDQVVAMGHARPYVVVLITLNNEVIGQARMPHDLRTRVEKELEQLNSHLATYERARSFAILENPLSVEKGELTPSLKVRRQVVEHLNRDLIDQLYQQSQNQR